MGHYIEAIIAKMPIDEKKAKDYGLAVAFEGNYAIVILFCDSIYYWSDKLSLDCDSKVEEFSLASETTFFLIKELAIDSYAYIKTDYFGGIGEQFAFFVAENQKVEQCKNINEALQKIGVTKKEGMDEFDTINLGEYRNMEGYYWDNFNMAHKKPNMIPGKVFLE